METRTREGAQGTESETVISMNDLIMVKIFCNQKQINKKELSILRCGSVPDLQFHEDSAPKKIRPSRSMVPTKINGHNKEG